MGGGPSSLAVISSIGDTFYPWNPDRRGRAEQLQKEVQFYISQFNEEKKALDALEPVVRRRIETYLKQNNYSTLDDLIRKTEDTLHGQALEDWKKLRASLSVGHWIDEFILTVTGLTAVASGVVIGGLVIFGVLSGPVGWAVFAGLGEVLGIIALAVVILSVIEADKEIDRLRDAIRKLWYARIDTLQTLRELQVYKAWVIEFSDWFKDDWTKLSPDIFEKKFGADFRAASWKFERSTIIEELRRSDEESHHWCEEDPEHPTKIDLPDNNFHAVDHHVSSLMAAPDKELQGADSEKPAEGSIDVVVLPNDGVERKMRLALRKVLSASDCIVEDTATHTLLGATISPSSAEKTTSGLLSAGITITNLSSHEVWQNCSVRVMQGAL